jgi:hypothetical protein
MTTQRRAEGGTAPLCPNLNARWGWVMNVMSRQLYPVHTGGGWVGPNASLDRFWRRENPLPAPWIESRIVQHVASRVTDYAIPASVEYIYRSTAQIL